MPSRNFYKMMKDSQTPKDENEIAIIVSFDGAIQICFNEFFTINQITKQLRNTLKMLRILIVTFCGPTIQPS